MPSESSCLSSVKNIIAEKTNPQQTECVRYCVCFFQTLHLHVPSVYISLQSLVLRKSGNTQSPKGHLQIASLVQPTVQNLKILPLLSGTTEKSTFSHFRGWNLQVLDIFAGKTTKKFHGLSKYLAIHVSFNN